MSKSHSNDEKGIEVEILGLFRRIAARRKPPELTPSMVHQRLWYNSGREYPITSVRRAMTVLTKKKSLQKLTKSKTGPYGKPEHFWKYVPSVKTDGIQTDLF